MVRETSLAPSDLIYPLFVVEGRDRREEIASMPGQFRLSVDLLVKEAGEVAALGIPAIILFGIPDRKDDRGSSGFDPNGIVQRAVKAVKDQVPGLMVVTDVCIDEYTDHGHCGIVKDGRILNDETLECLRAMARTHAQAGADMVAPSDMMDGRVAAIRAELDQAGFPELPIMAYAAKVRILLLRTVSGCGVFKSSVRRSAVVPDGSRQPPGSASGDRSRCRRRGRHHHGETGTAVSRYHCRGQGADVVAGGGLSSEWGVQHDQSGRQRWLARRIAGHDGIVALD